MVFSNQTWAVSLSKGFGVGQGKNVGQLGPCVFLKHIFLGVEDDAYARDRLTMKIPLHVVVHDFGPQQQNKTEIALCPIII